MVCRKMIIGYFGGCDCEVCLSINSKGKNNHCSNQKNIYKEITWTNCDCQENIEEDIKHVKDSVYKDKKPNHPGNIARSFLEQIYNRDEDLFSFKIIGNIARELYVDRYFIDRLFNGLENVDYVLAYKLARLIRGTDIRFWIGLQEKYDEYMENNK